MLRYNLFCFILNDISSLGLWILLILTQYSGEERGLILNMLWLNTHLCTVSILLFRLMAVVSAKWIGSVSGSWQYDGSTCQVEFPDSADSDCGNASPDIASLLYAGDKLTNSIFQCHIQKDFPIFPILSRIPRIDYNFFQIHFKSVLSSTVEQADERYCLECSVMCFQRDCTNLWVAQRAGKFWIWQTVIPRRSC